MGEVRSYFDKALQYHLATLMVVQEVVQHVAIFQGLRLQKRCINGCIIKPKIFSENRGRSTSCNRIGVCSTSCLMKEDRFLCPRFLLESFPYKEFISFNMSLGTRFIHKIVSTVIAVI